MTLRLWRMRTRLIYIAYLIGTAIVVAGWLWAIGWLAAKLANRLFS
jgi:hypothetical protein